MVFYFAYASNMDPAGMQAKAPSARFYTLGRLADYYLGFGVPTPAGTMKAGICPRHDTAVWGVVYAIDESDWDALDAAEPGYAHAQLTVQTSSGPLEVTTYLPEIWEEGEGLPSRAYLDTIIRGAKASGLPPEYVAMLEWEDTQD